MKRLLPLIVALAFPSAALAQQPAPEEPPSDTPAAAPAAAPTAVEEAPAAPPAAAEIAAETAPSGPETATGTAAPEPAAAPAVPQEAPVAAAKEGAAAAAAEPPPQSPEEELFAEKCGSCHSIGKGDRVGPDLKGAHERRNQDWLVQMIGKPGSMLDSDPVAREMLKKYKNVRMPDLGLQPDQVQALVALIERCSTETCNLAGQFIPVTKATADDVETGRQLFLGLTKLKNDGPPCVSCHTARGTDTIIAGGTLAKDLTHVFARLGDEGLDAALKNPAFPLMKDIYATRAIAKEEAFALRAFLSASNRVDGAKGDSFSVLLAGVLGALLCLVVLNALWSRRLRGIRKPLTQTGGVA